MGSRGKVPGKGRIPLKQKLDKSMPPGFSGFYLIEVQIVFKDYGLQSITLVKYGESGHYHSDADIYHQKTRTQNTCKIQYTLLATYSNLS